MAKFFGKGEESGYSDPFGDGCPNNFDIVQFINDSNETPVDSPADPSRFLNNCGSLLHHSQQQQAQHNQQIQQQLLARQNNLNNNNNMQQQQQQQVRLANNNAGIMYTNGTTRLPDSPPITDISAGGSSASPSSGSDLSPFSPEQYRTFHGVAQNGNGVLHMQQVSNHPHQLGNDPAMLLTDDLVHQMHLQQRIIQQQQQQLSPQSEFLSPYPPSQSTPGSQHSSQVSPPAIGNQQTCSIGGYIQAPPNHFDLYRGGMSSGSGSNSSDLDMECGAGNVQQRSMQGQKRRRTSTSIIGGNGNNNSLPNVKTEYDGGATNGNRQRLPFQQQQNQYDGNGRHPGVATPRLRSALSQQSFDDFDEQGIQRTLKFSPFMPETWSVLYEAYNNPISSLQVSIVADKGFNFSAQDNCFISQKKNHAQITVSIPKLNAKPPYYVRLSNGELQPIHEFVLIFCGAKHEMPTSEVQVRQSTTERKPVPHEGTRFQIDPSMPTKQTVPRLHFAETTLNNHRKNGKPNPEQKYFLLVVKLMAVTPLGNVLVQAYQSDRIIVRASNPGQFEQPESDVAWQRANGNALHFNGQVAIGTDKPIQDAQLTVLGNVVTSGQITRPSDRRVKEDISDLDTRDAMNRLSNMRIVEYSYKPEIAKQWGLTEENRHRVGVIAQELAEVLPDAVRDNGEFLTVDDTRIFYDTVAAAQELYRLTGNLECKIDQVEKISQKLARFAQKRKTLGSMASGISDFSNILGTTPAAGGNNKSYISYSRTSLASTASEPTESRKRRGHSRDPKPPRSLCRSSSYCQRYGGGATDSTLCTSKVTQGTIVTLVAIMALCLMAMCTLYVLDWYNRTYVYTPHFYHNLPTPPAPTRNSEELPVGLYYELIDWKPPKESKAPPLAATCGLQAHCPIFCCAAQHSYSLDKAGATISQGSDAEVGSVLLMSPTDRHQLFPSVRNFEDKSLMGKLDYIPRELESEVRIEVINLNASLDSRYCVNQSCDARKGRFNLYVPISPHLPTIPLQLKISVEDGLFVDNCGSLVGFKHKPCEYQEQEKKGKAFVKNNHALLDSPVSSRVTENIFELSIGGFTQSAFRFRIGHTTESCNMSEDQQGRSFDEYNLVFYRTCAALERKTNL